MRVKILACCVPVLIVAPWAGIVASPPDQAPRSPPSYTPLFDTEYSPEESANWRVEPDGTIVTFGSGRARSRHESENSFYTFPARYHEHRSFGFEIHDHVAAGGNSITIYYEPQYAHWREPECRSFYGNPYRADFNNNARFDPVPVQPAAPDGSGQKWRCRITYNAHAGSDGVLRIGDRVEVEFQQFLGLYAGDPVVHGQTIYYTDTYRFRLGQPGLFLDGDEVLNERIATGGQATAPFVRAGDTVEPAAVVGQTGDMLTYVDAQGNVVTHRILDGIGVYPTYVVASGNADWTSYFREPLNLRWPTHQAFLEGRRLFHSSFRTGAHAEPGNPDHAGIAGLAGGLHVHDSCIACHANNGRGRAPDDGAVFDSMVMKVGSGAIGTDGGTLPHYHFGRTLQPRSFDPAIPTEPRSRVRYLDVDGQYADGTPYRLRRPVYAVVDGADRIFASSLEPNEPPGRGIAHYSPRMPQSIIGLGLLEAVDEETLLLRHDPDDLDGDGISGRVSLVHDPQVPEPRIGRFGWKADAYSLEHFSAGALRDDIGVRSQLAPVLDCAVAQPECQQQAQAAPMVGDEDLRLLTLYVQTTGAPARRPDTVDLPAVVAGEALFSSIGCSGCHLPSLTTGMRHPIAELRGQTIRAYTDLLLHDMGDGLADSLTTSTARNREWRTPPLWGLGLRHAVNGHGRLLHDGRAGDIAEAILWHGGEAAATREAFRTLSAGDRARLIAFLESL